jgi:hypothetical protein
MSQAQQLETLIKRLEAVASRLETSGETGAKSDSGSSAQQAAPEVASYDEYVSNHVAPFLATCRDIGGDLNGLVNLFISID